MSAYQALPLLGLVPSNSQYHAELEAQHFGHGATAGSVFTIVNSLNEWLQHAEQIRGSLLGNDRDLIAAALRAAGIKEDPITRTLRPDCRYLLIKSHSPVGNFGMVELRPWRSTNPMLHCYLADRSTARLTVCLPAILTA